MVVCSCEELQLGSTPGACRFDQNVTTIPHFGVGIFASVAEASRIGHDQPSRTSGAA